MIQEVRDIILDRFMSCFNYGSFTQPTSYKVGYRSILQKPYCYYKQVGSSYEYLTGFTSAAVVDKPNQTDYPDFDLPPVVTYEGYKYSSASISTEDTYKALLQKSFGYYFPIVIPAAFRTPPAVSYNGKSNSHQLYLLDQSDNILFPVSSTIFGRGSSRFVGQDSLLFTTEATDKILTGNYILPEYVSSFLSPIETLMRLVVLSNLETVTPLKIQRANVSTFSTVWGVDYYDIVESDIVNVGSVESVTTVSFRILLSSTVLYPGCDEYNDGYLTCLCSGINPWLMISQARPNCGLPDEYRETPSVIVGR